MGLASRLAARTVEPAVENEPGELTLARDDDPLSAMKVKLHRALLEAMGPKLYDASLTQAKLETQVRKHLAELVGEEAVPMTADDRRRLVAESVDDILGYGPITPFLADETITEIMVNGTEPVYVERGGRIERTPVRFANDAHVRRTIDRIVGEVGRRIDEASPYVDARLPDGSRVNAVIPPIAIDGPTLTVRKFAADPFTVDDLVELATFSRRTAELLEACVSGRLNILVSGGTGAGKTTTLNVLSSFIDDAERIVTIEDAAELKLQQPHVVRLESRPPNIEGRGQVTIRDLVRNALRMRPDRIVVGEVRGAEALDMLQALNTGHDGSITTVHANSPRDVLSRLETMVMMAGMELPVRVIREQIAGAVDLVVHQARFRDGIRRITHVTEVVGMEGETITMQDIYLFDFSAGIDEAGRFQGDLQATGIRPHFAGHLEDVGVSLPAELFAIGATGAPIGRRARR